MEGCKPRNENKYLIRNSPGYSAADCPNVRMEGNDGNMYISQKRGAAKSYRWYKMVKKYSKRKSIVKILKKRMSKKITNRSKVRKSKPKIRRSINKIPEKKGKPCNPKSAKANDDRFMCNPSSGRWILKKSINKQRKSIKRSVIMQKLRKQRKSIKRKRVPKRKSIKKKKNEGHPDYILNPISGSWVLKRGAIGRRIQRNIDNENSNKCIVDKPISQYQRSELYDKCVHGCKLPFLSRIQIQDTRMLYNLILWHSGKCANESSLIGDPVQDIEKKKLIRLNDSCYDVDNLVQTLMANGDKNQDIYSPAKKLWKSQCDKELITKHPGLDPDIGKRYVEMIKKQEEENRKLMISDPKAPDIIKTIMEVGWIAFNDNPSSHDHNNPEQFEISQLALHNLMNTINNLPNKEHWDAFSFRGLRLGSILNSLADTCIHGIGSKLIKLGYFMFLSSFELGIMIKLPDVFTVLEDSIRYPQAFEEYYMKNDKSGRYLGKIVFQKRDGGFSNEYITKEKGFNKKDVKDMKDIYQKWERIKRKQKDIIEIRTTVPKRALASRILYYIKTNSPKEIKAVIKENPKYKKLNGDPFLTSVLNGSRFNSQTVSMVDIIINNFKMSKKSEFIINVVVKLISKKSNTNLQRILEMLLENKFSVDATTFELANNKPTLLKKIMKYVPLTTKVLGYMKKMEDIAKACSNPEDNILFEPWNNDSDLIMFDNMGSYCLNRDSIEQFWKSNDQSYEQDIPYALKHDGDPNPSKKVYAVYTPGIVYVDEEGHDLLMNQTHITYSLVHPKEFMVIKKDALPSSQDIYQVYPRNSVHDYA
jgi:hypothetical protein